MAVILQDPALPRDPTFRRAFPDAEAEATLSASAPRTLAEELLAGFRPVGAMTEPSSTESSFELQSRGGYARTVTLRDDDELRSGRDVGRSRHGARPAVGRTSQAARITGSFLRMKRG